MNNSESNAYGKVHALTVRQLDGSLTPAEHGELESLLLESAAARREYVAYFQDTACLRWLCLEELTRVDDPLNSPRNEAAPRSTRRRIEAIVFFGGVACLFAMIIANLLYDRWTSTTSSSLNSADANVAANSSATNADEPGEQKTPNVQPERASSTQVATVTGLGAVRWSNADRNRTHLLSRCSIGDTLQLVGGAVELTFDAGAQVTVFGPADFTITSATSIQCKRGRVTAVVGERGRGFVVLTPQARVIDLGTQFGLSISENGETEVVVFQGSVDMSYASPAGTASAPSRRLRQGDALLLNNLGEFQRVVSIQRNDFLTAVESFRQRPSEPVITDVRDNLRTAEGVKSYQIVRGGLDEDAPCFVDRNHQWNGINRDGLPEFLVGADYVMPFNDDKFVRTLELKLSLLRPAYLYVFLDNNMEVPDWIRSEFEDTGTDIGLDGAQTEWHPGHSLSLGAGRSVDFPFSVWRRYVKTAGTVTLGPVNPPKLGTRSYGFNMYGIAAVAAD